MMNDFKVLILVDYTEQFWLKSDYKEANFNVALLQQNFKILGYNVTVKQFSDLDFKNENYNETFVIYQSSEDPDHFYYSFIEDCLLGLKLKGAILLPKFEYFRAHDNKVFMEILRDVNSDKGLRSLSSTYYGAFEEYKRKIDMNKALAPKVFKLYSGAQSKNVFLLKTERDLLKIPKKKTKTFNFYYWLVDKVKPYLKKRYPNYRKKSHSRRKFIIQDFVEDLKGDFKILIYGSKYFVLSRSVKPNDFKASGSGLFDFTKELPEGLLKYAKNCFESFDSPFMGLDIAEKNGEFYVIEFQFVHFGNYTLEKSPFHFENIEENKWKVIEGEVVLEEVFVATIDEYIKK
jgi:glutathione synthase/RimK-type ligase-like ATP-grasp enzyme